MGSQSGSQNAAQLAADYRLLYDKLQRERLDTTVEGYQLLLEKCNELHQHVQNPKEHRFDAEVFHQLAQVANVTAQRLTQRQRGAVSVPEFLAALKAKYVRHVNAQTVVFEQPELFNWQQLAHDATKYLKPAPGVNCMLGPMDAQAKARKAMAARARQKPVDVVKPTSEVVPPGTQQEETDRTMEEMYDKLTQRGTCPWPELVCNHQSFAQTVENMFSLAFLVKDGKVRLESDPQHGLVAHFWNAKKQRLTADAQADGAPGPSRPTSAAPPAAQARQCVVSFSQADWRMMCALVRPADCVMAHRADQVHLEQTLARKQARQAAAV